MKIKKAILFRQQRKLYKKKKSNVTVLKHKTQGFPGNRQHYSYQCLNILPIKIKIVEVQRHNKVWRMKQGVHAIVYNYS